MVVLDRLIDVGQRLGFDALGRVDHQQSTFARGEAATDLISEIDVAGGVHQIELIALPGEADGLRLDGDSALALDVHIVEHLLVAAHLAVGEAAGRLDQAVGQRAFPMINVGNYRKIADARDVGHFPAR